MAKKAIPKVYVKLGPLAGGFTDPHSRFKILKGQVKQLVTQQEKTSGKIKAAIRGGHLVAVPEKEYEEYLESLKPKAEGVAEKEDNKEPTLKEKLEELTKAGLLDYYKENYEVDEDQIAAFDKLKHEDRVTELLELDKQSKDD